jgi:hypothetical protein
MLAATADHPLRRGQEPDNEMSAATGGTIFGATQHGRRHGKVPTWQSGVTPGRRHKRARPTDTAGTVTSFAEGPITNSEYVNSKLVGAPTERPAPTGFRRLGYICLYCIK